MRYGVVTDIHSNYIALQAVLQKIETTGPIDGLLCMGDIVGYGPQPNEVIDLLREYALFSIIGNHDLAVLGKLPLEDFNRDAIDSNIWTRMQLTEPNFSWLDSMEAMAQFNDVVTLAHGSPSEPIWEYLSTPHAAERNFEASPTQLCFVGHTHLPRFFRQKKVAEPMLDLPENLKWINNLFDESAVEVIIPEAGQVIQLGNEKCIINPGSVGQPRDSDKRAAYCVYDDSTMTLSFDRVEYDIQQTQELMRQAMLPARLIMRLDYGM